MFTFTTIIGFMMRYNIKHPCNMLGYKKVSNVRDLYIQLTKHVFTHIMLFAVARDRPIR